MPTFDASKPCYEILPAQKSCPRHGITWRASQTERGGLLEISSKRNACEYLLVEIEADGGRGFRFVKTKPGSDPTEASYDVFCATEPGFFDSCTCKGHSRHGTPCRHILALAALIENRWLPTDLDPPAVPAPAFEDDMPECFRGVGSAPGADCPF